MREFISDKVCILANELYFVIKFYVSFYTMHWSLEMECTLVLVNQYLPLDAAYMPRCDILRRISASLHCGHRKAGLLFRASAARWRCVISPESIWRFHDGLMMRLWGRKNYTPVCLPFYWNLHCSRGVNTDKSGRCVPLYVCYVVQEANSINAVWILMIWFSHSANDSLP